jgi:hypothetical protein
MPHKREVHKDDSDEEEEEKESDDGYGFDDGDFGF